MHCTRRQIVALTAAAAWLLQAWLGATHVHPHMHQSCCDASATSVRHAHEHDHAAGHDHGHTSHAPAKGSGDEHRSDDCQICRLLAEQPLPLVAVWDLADAAPLPATIVFSHDVPNIRPTRLFQSRAPPTQSV